MDSMNLPSSSSKSEPLNGLPPVILVPGFRDTGAKMKPLERYLRQRNREAYACTLTPSSGEIGIDRMAKQVQQFIECTCPTAPRVDLVGFSMGGLVCRYYLQRLNGLARVRRFVTISTPHRGSVLAWFVSNDACRQMRPGSAFLKDLQQDEHHLASVGFTSFWTPLDLMILPARSSVLEVARCRRVLCMAHPLMVWENRCLRLVNEVLSAPA